jgi:hypothetical protein
VRWANSAFRHGISEERSQYVVEHAFGVFDVPASNDPSVDRLLFLGDDADGVPLEVVAAEVLVDEDEWDLLVIHAMPLRAAYRPLYEEAVRARFMESGPWQQ